MAINLRMGEPMEVARVALFQAPDETSPVNGAQAAPDSIEHKAVIPGRRDS
jgi:NAD(P)-dependent dehydrogenase (short-subunit alcohol dehydrogenase family)